MALRFGLLGQRNQFLVNSTWERPVLELQGQVVCTCSSQVTLYSLIAMEAVRPDESLDGSQDGCGYISWMGNGRYTVENYICNIKQGTLARSYLC